MSDDTAAKALDLRRAGVTPLRIAEQLELGGAAEANELVSAALAASAHVATLAEVRALELDRLDRLQQGLWVRAARGEVSAISAVLKITAFRVRLASAPESERKMLAAYEASVAELPLSDADQALVEAGRVICDQIDTAGASGDPEGQQRAMYLVPHLVNVLRSLGATPDARDATTGAIRPPEQRENELATFKRKRRERAAGN